MYSRGINKNFCFNFPDIADFENLNAYDFVNPIISGFVDSILYEKSQEDGVKNMKFTLISRRCIHRLGVRFWRRGTDYVSFNKT